MKGLALNSMKRGRGRPVGTGIDDVPILSKIADIILANPSLRPTTVIRQCLDKPGPSIIRRLQVKWKERSAEFMDQARSRRDAAISRSPSQQVGGLLLTSQAVRQMLEVQRKMHEMMNIPGLRAAHELMSSPTFIAAQDAARRIQANPAFRALEELRKKPTMEALRGFNANPTLKVLREFEEGDAMHAVREATEAASRIYRKAVGGKLA